MTEKEFFYDLVHIASQDLFIATFYGPVSISRLAEAHDKFLEHPQYHNSIDEALDFSNTTLDGLSQRGIEAIRTYMTSAETRHNSRSAIIVNSKLEFGITRMMGAHLDGSAPVDRGVFHDMESAFEWLRPGEAQSILQAYKARNEEAE